MQESRLEKLQSDYVGREVIIDGDPGRFGRFAGKRGRVKAINHNGCALVQLEGTADTGWHDFALDYLRVVDEPPQQTAPTGNGASEKSTSEAKYKPSSLEIARRERAEETAAGQPVQGDTDTPHSPQEKASPRRSA